MSLSSRNSENYEDEDENSNEQWKERNSISEKNTVAKVLNLSEICLESIRNNFNSFIEAHKDSTDDIMRRNLRFLQRRYSGHLLNIFCISNEQGLFQDYLENIYFRFLLNEHLRELNTSIFRSEDLEVALCCLKDIGHSFEKVTFQYKLSYNELGEKDDSPSTDFLQKFVHVFLPRLTNVSSLTMHRSTKCTDETVKMIYSTCKELKELTFDRCCSITDEGLKSLCPDDSKLNLKSLNLSFMRDCDDGVIHLLKNMSSLETIEYDNLPNILLKIHLSDWLNNSMASVRKYNLTSMMINTYLNFRNDIDAFEQTLAIVAEVCPALKKLSVGDVTKNEHLVAVTKFPDLVDVSISGHDKGRLDLDEFLRVSGKQLQILELHCFRVSVPLLLKSCPRLESLRLGSIEYTDVLEQKSLSPLCSLKKLVVEGFDPGAEKSLQMLLQSCPNLEKLVFTCCAFEAEQDDIIQGFCEKAEGLDSLTFTGCTIEEALLQHIVLTCRSLKTLVVDLCDYIGSYEIGNLREIIKTSKSSLVIECTSKSEIDYFSNEEDVDDDYLSDRWDDNFDYEYEDEDGYDNEDDDYEDLYFSYG